MNQLAKQCGSLALAAGIGASAAFTGAAAQEAVFRPTGIPTIDAYCQYGLQNEDCIMETYNYAMDLSTDMMTNEDITYDPNNFDEKFRNSSHFDICVRMREVNYNDEYGPRPLINQARFCVNEAASITEFYDADYDENLLARLNAHLDRVSPPPDYSPS